MSLTSKNFLFCRLFNMTDYKSLSTLHFCKTISQIVYTTSLWFIIISFVFLLTSSLHSSFLRSYFRLFTLSALQIITIPAASQPTSNTHSTFLKSYFVPNIPFHVFAYQKGNKNISFFYPCSIFQFMSSP